ncbi:hypothetical protein AAFF_G00261490, partial [Aldrovandia affinis]
AGSVVAELRYQRRRGCVPRQASGSCARLVFKVPRGWTGPNLLASRYALSEMSENEFRAQLASVMAILVDAAVHETTRLYRSGVLELRVEMAQVKRENQALKSRLRFPEGEWRPGEPQQGRQHVDSTIIDGVRQKCAQTETRAGAGPEECCGSLWPFPDPSPQENGAQEEEEEEEEEEEGARLCPAPSPLSRRKAPKWSSFSSNRRTLMWRRTCWRVIPSNVRLAPHT